jgi:hypothetical protein
MKKIAILVFVYYFTAVVISCCPKPDCIPYISLKSGVVRLFVNGNYQQIGNFTFPAGTDTVRCEVDFIREFLSKQTTQPAGLISTAYAFSCSTCNNGEQGLRDKIRRITLTSTQPYNGIAAGSSLNAFYRFGVNAAINIQPIYRSLDSLAVFLNQGTTATFPVYIRSGIKPGNSNTHRLQMRFEFESGQSFTAPSPDFVWN